MFCQTHILLAVRIKVIFGKHSGVEPEPHRWEHMVISSQIDPDLAIIGWQQAASGYAGVWATENTREAIFDVTTDEGVEEGGGVNLGSLSYLR